MSMKSALRLALVVLFFVVAAFHVAAQGRNPFFAGYQGKSFDGEHEMKWSFGRKNDGSITVGLFIPNPDAAKVKGKKPPPNFGQAEGINVKLDGDTLAFELKWSQRHKVKGPDASCVATVRGNDLLVKWTSGDEKGEITAVNTTNPVVVAKKNDKKDEKKPAIAGEKGDEKPKAKGEKTYLSNLMDERGNPATNGAVTQLSVVIVGAKSSKAQFYNVTKDTKFVVIDGDENKAYDQKTVLADPAVRGAFRERYVTLERQGNIVLTVTATAPKKKN
jgi:hypothetical protein